MSEEHDDVSDADAQLEELFEAVSDLRGKCLMQSAMRTTLEARRLAKAERRLMPYLMANFYVMNVSQALFDPQAGREAAVENIALLESPDRARTFQGDYDEGHYEHTVQWMSACSYDNLATATAMLQGYNSPGMQACIADGIQVCRRTGKLKCVACFREYATNVFRAADDLAMAMHHARTNAAVQPAGRDAGDDRRFVGARDVAELLLLTGQLEPAWAAAANALELAETYHTPADARRLARQVMRLVGHLAGRADWAEAGAALAPADRTPRGEDPAQDLRDDQADAVADACRGEHAKAIERLVPWDKYLTDRKCVHAWLDLRLQLVALHRLAGQTDRAAALAKPLEKRARDADDFLTLRRLEKMMNGALPTAPYPTVGPFTAGPFAGGATSHAGQTSMGEAGAAGAAPGAAEATAPAVSLGGKQEPAPDEPGPLRPFIEERIAQMNTAFEAAAADPETPPDLGRLVEQILALPPETVAHADDAGRLLHLLDFLGRGPDVPHERVWAWGRAVAGRFPTHAKVIAIAAQLADGLRRAEGSPLADRINVDALAAQFRQAMDLDPKWAGGFARAGAFFLAEGDDAEAERCLARAFRLKRDDERVAAQLAEVYAGTDRPADALAVLDMCLREGAESPDLLWNAATRAVALGRHESALTYLDRYEAVIPGRPWVNYYRGVALLALNRAAEALDAADREGERIARPDALHLASIRAAAAAQLDRPDDVRRHLDAALATPLGSIDDLTLAGIASCHDRMWIATTKLPSDDPVMQRVTDRLLTSGLTPDELWEWHRARASAEPVAGLTHFVCDLRQRLGAKWTQSPACPPGWGEWPACDIRYGVLAPSEDEARDAVLSWQSRSAAGLPRAEVLSIDPDGGPFTDRPGVTWRTPPAEADAEVETDVE